MYTEMYFKAVDDLLNKIKNTQADAIKKAASIIADSVMAGGAVHLLDTGHIINHELVDRAGGLALFKRLDYSFNVEDPVIKREKEPFSMEGLAKYILGSSNVIRGDILIMGSVSGKSESVVDIALCAKELGVKLIAVTSIEYSSGIKSDHSSGKRLFEAADVVIDNCAPVGDAMLKVEEIGMKICPASGLASAFIMWTITSQLVENLIEKGLKPTSV